MSDLLDTDLSIRLPMALPSAVALLGAVLPDQDLVTAALSLHPAGYPGSLYQWLTDSCAGITRDE
jgi:hypothetical protein